MVRCPECAVEIDLDEDEVEEGEILNCPECEAELEVVQIHPVHLNVISEDDDDDDEDDDEDDEKRKKRKRKMTVICRTKSWKRGGGRGVTFWLRPLHPGPLSMPS